MKGPAAGQRIALGPEPFLIGRTEEGDGALAGDPEISRSHAEIREEDGDWVVEDLDSTNGTFVNGRKIDSPTRIKPGDTLRVGTSTLHVEGGVAQPDVTSVREVASGQPTAARAVAGPPALEVVSGPAKGTELPLSGGELVLGREAEGPGNLGEDAELSRRHARVTVSGGRLAIEDLGSTNGTLVNGREIDERTTLHPGDTVELGTTTLKVTGGAAAPAEEAEPDDEVAAADVTAVRAVPGRTAAAAPPSGEPGQAWLRVVAGNAVGTTISLTEEPFTMGRAEEGAGGLAGDPELSRRHARVSRVDGRIVIEDLGSTNGTFVNGLRIPAPTVIEAGDVVWIGTTTLTVTTPEQPVPEVAPVEPPPPRAESGLIGRFAALSDRNPKRVLTFVAILFVISVPLGGPVAGLLGAEDPFADPNAENVKVSERVAEATGEEGAPQVIAVLRNAPVDSSQTRQRVDRIVAEMRKEKLVTRVATFYSTNDRAFVSKDERSTFVAAFFKDADETPIEDAATAIKEDISDPPEVIVGGAAVMSSEVAEQVGMDLGKAEGMAFPLLFLLSLFVFRGFVAALMPLFVGILTVLTTFLVLRIINEIYALSEFALNVVIALGLGLAIDYSLFVVSRYREELAKVGEGRPPSAVYGAVPRSEAGGQFAGTESEALLRAMYTAGRTIFYSAVTVAIALASLALFPQPFLRSMGIGGAVCALVAVTVALVALPALLAVLGPKINAGAPERWKQSAQRTARQEQEGGWYRLSQFVMRRPALVALVSAGFLILVGIPALGIKFAGFDSRVVPEHLDSRKVDDALSTEFRSNPSPEVTVLAEAPRSAAPQVESLAAELRKEPGINPQGPDPQPLRGDIWNITLLPKGSALDDPTIDAVESVRDREFEGRPLLVGGDTASFLDLRSSISSRLPVAVLILAMLTIVVLFLMTGSVVLPLKSVLMNALSLTAAFGILVLIFQEGNLEGVLGFESIGAVDLTQPVLLFAIAFGLATDYAVFLLTRIREAREAGASDRDAVAIGIERTGRIVTQAALLFCVAVGAFATSSVIFIKEVGVGTAFAVIIDATIIRAFLVPSLMALLGARNWWAPAPLRRLHEKIGLSEG